MLALSHRQSTHRMYWYLLTGGVGAGILAFLLLDPNGESSWILLGLASIPAVMMCMVKFPATFIVPVIVLPQVKDWPVLASLQGQVELEVFFLILLGVTILLNFALDSGEQGGWPIRRRLAGQGKGIAAFFVFAAVIALSHLYTPGPNYGGGVVYRLWGIGGLLFLSPLILVRQERDFRHFVGAFLFGATALAVALLARIASWAPGGTKDVTHINAGWLVGMAILLVLQYRLFERRLPQSLTTLFCLPVLVVGLLASFSRGPILSLIPAFVLASLLLNARQKVAPRILRVVGVLVFFIVGYLVFSSFIQGVPVLREKYAAKTTELEQLWAGTETTGSGGQRLPLYESAFQAILERPFLGMGVGGWSVYRYGREANKLDPTVEAYPHNLFLLVGAEEGVVGLIALFVFLGTTVFAIRAILVVTGNRFLVLPALLMFLVSTGMFSGGIDDARLLWLWCGMSLAIARVVREWQVRGSFAPSLPRRQPAPG